MTWRYPSTAETCRHRRTNKLRSLVVFWRTHPPSSTNVHSEYVTLIIFPRKQWLHERASLLHYMYISFLVLFVTGTFNVYEGLSSSGAPRINSFTENRWLLLIYALQTWRWLMLGLQARWQQMRVNAQTDRLNFI